MHFAVASLRWSRWMLASLIALAPLACQPGVGPAPAPIPPPIQPSTESPGDITAGMLRVAAEAADGYRTGRPVHVLVTPGPNPRPSVFSTLAEAEAARLRGFGAYVGVFRTPPDTTSPTLGRVIAVRVSILRPDGDTIHWAVPVDSVDLIAWSMPSIEKFVIPYYARLYGADFAQRFRTQYFNTVENLLYCHDYMSIECPFMGSEAELDDGGGEVRED